MKKIVLLSLFVAGIVTAGHSQFIKKGTIIGGGAFEFRSLKDNDSDFKVSTFSLMPWAGYLVVDNFVAGALLDIGTTTVKSGGTKSTNNSFMIGPVARYYMDNGLFAHGQFAFGSGKFTNTAGFESKSSNSELKLGIGYAVRITDTVLFEPIAGYLSTSSKDKSSNVKSTDSGFFLMGGFTIFLRSTN